MSDGRKCTKCEQWKSWSEFGKRKRNKSGYNCVCKVCYNFEIRSRRQKNRKQSFKKDGIEFEISSRPDKRYFEAIQKLADFILENWIKEDEGKITNRKNFITASGDYHIYSI